MAMQFNMSAVSKMFEQAAAVATTLPREAYDVFRDNTPQRSGNAYRSTRLSGSTIDANYAYAEKLDEGYSQKKPDGMTRPTEEFLEKRVKELIGKIK